MPVSKRGYSLAVLTAFVLPFCPYVLYAQLFSQRYSWRVGPWISLAYNGLTALGLLLTYFPHAHVSKAKGKMLLLISFQLLSKMAPNRPTFVLSVPLEVGWLRNILTLLFMTGPC